ncbi:hypothetical protein BRADI_2g04805v3 [Brachypodium distachyon]|uniref:Uncharacterized protein n=1 Tax=Brachypodium distachyon TaxID=15368 RepID=A0A2K2D712_BRADI|nr:hypothetical protein BRADI_2g04805v3 [Brachypodium distachyon]
MLHLVPSSHPHPPLRHAHRACRCSKQTRRWCRERRRRCGDGHRGGDPGVDDSNICCKPTATGARRMAVSISLKQSMRLGHGQLAVAGHRQPNGRMWTRRKGGLLARIGMGVRRRGRGGLEEGCQRNLWLRSQPEPYLATKLYIRPQTEAYGNREEISLGRRA